MESPLRKRSLKRVTEGSHWRESQQVLFCMISVLRLDAALLVPVYEELIRNRESLRNGTQTKITTSVQFSSSVVSASLWPHESQHARSFCASLTPGVQPNMIPSNHLILCCPLLPPSIIPSIRVFSNETALCIRWPKYWSLASTSVLPMNTQDWSPLGWTGWIILQSKGLSGVFSNTTVQKHKFFSA